MAYLLTVLVLVAAGLAIAGIASAASFEGKGTFGERWVNSILRRYLDDRDYRVIPDLTLPSFDGTAQIDHVIVSRFGLFVIETKNMDGWIFGDADHSQWTQVLFHRKSRFQNPVRQNYYHTKTVCSILGIPENKIHGLVVFVGNATPKTRMPRSVVWGIKEMVEWIKSKHIALFDESELDPLVEKLLEKRLKPGRRTRRSHIRHVKEVAGRKRRDTTKCPLCGRTMIERTNRHSGERFLGCSGYPRCRGSRTLD